MDSIKKVASSTKTKHSSFARFARGFFIFFFFRFCARSFRRREVNVCICVVDEFTWRQNFKLFLSPNRADQFNSRIFSTRLVRQTTWNNREIKHEVTFSEKNFRCRRCQSNLSSLTWWLRKPIIHGYQRACADCSLPAYALYVRSGCVLWCLQRTVCTLWTFFPIW